MRHRAGPWLSLLLRVTSLLSVAYFVLWACAPPAAFPPPVPMAADESTELGIGGAVHSVYYRDPDVVRLVQTRWAEAWGYHQFNRRLDLGGEVYGTREGVGGGVFGRYFFLENDRLRMGGQLSAGWLHLGVSLPIGVRVSDRLWFYSSASAAFAPSIDLRVPVGLSLRVGRHFLVNTELGGSWQVAESPPGFYVAAGAGARF